VRDKNSHRRRLLALLLFAPVIAGCSSASDMFSSDLLSKDAEWFSRSGRLFIRNVSIETPPLTPNKPITSDDLVSAEGYCPGMAPPGGPASSNALAEGPAASPPPTTTGTVALGHTECDVVRGIGAPGSVSLSNNGRNLYLHGWTPDLDRAGARRGAAAQADKVEKEAGGDLRVFGGGKSFRGMIGGGISI
jgi:hypothetical protein